jgi:hypothetical protein
VRVSVRNSAGRSRSLDVEALEALRISGLNLLIAMCFCALGPLCQGGMNVANHHN